MHVFLAPPPFREMQQKKGGTFFILQKTIQNAHCHRDYGTKTLSNCINC